MRLQISLLIILFLSCKSADDLYKKGDYNGAFEKALKKIEKDKDVSRNKIILNKSMNKLIGQLETSYAKASNYNNLDKLTEYYQTSVKTVDLALEGKSYLTDENDLKLKNESKRQKESRQYLIDEYTKIVDEKLDEARKNNDKKAAQQAMAILSNNGRLFGNYDNERMDEAIALGMMYYNFNVDHGFNLWYSNMMDSRFDDIVSESEDIVTVTYRKRHDKLDCDVLVRFNSLDEDKTYEDINTNYTESIEDGYDITIDTSGKEIKTPRFIDVSAKVTERKEKLTYSFDIRCDVNVISRFCDMRDYSFDVEEESIITEFIYSGDKRAIPPNILNQINNTQNHKRKDDIVESLIQEVYDMVKRKYF